MGKLALTGGPKTVTVDRRKYRVPPVSEQAIADVVELMRKGETSVSPIVADFEREFAEFIGAKHALAVTSGTAALHSAVFAAGVGPGDEVIAPSFAFPTTATVIPAVGATTVFCDVDADTHNVDPADIARRITPKTRAIVVLHIWGNPCDMGPILELARPRGIVVIEDCSHAHGAVWQGTKVGVVGDIGCFSCQGSKILPAGEGGVLTTNNPEYYERAFILGRAEKRAELREEAWSRNFSFTGLGFKYRPHPLGIAIARDVLRHLNELNDMRDHQGAALDAALADVPAVVPQRVLPGCRRVYAYHFMRYEPEQLEGVTTETFLRALAAEGVGAGRIGYGRLHGQTLFREGFPYGPGRSMSTVSGHPVPDYANGPLPVTERLRETAFHGAPRFEVECPELIEQYAAAFRKVASAVDELLAYDKEQAGKRAAVEVSARTLNPV
ncbi:MAG: DegT/DnrJ/EryC1/StrS family aminotransferase [Armatimonadetes bacterium]|nr:DegT/DnrJ/EryC1/StrS family aminotransferase [Armatimonadota bacterium]